MHALRPPSEQDRRRRPFERVQWQSGDSEKKAFTKRDRERKKRGGELLPITYARRRFHFTVPKYGCSMGQPTLAPTFALHVSSVFFTIYSHLAHSQFKKPSGQREQGLSRCRPNDGQRKRAEPGLFEAIRLHLWALKFCRSSFVPKAEAVIDNRTWRHTLYMYIQCDPRIVDFCEPALELS